MVRAGGFYLTAVVVGYVLLGVVALNAPDIVNGLLEFFKTLPTDLTKKFNLSYNTYLWLQILLSKHGLVALCFVLFARILVSVAFWVAGEREDD